MTIWQWGLAVIGGIALGGLLFGLIGEVKFWWQEWHWPKTVPSPHGPVKVPRGRELRQAKHFFRRASTKDTTLNLPLVRDFQQGTLMAAYATPGDYVMVHIEARVKIETTVTRPEGLQSQYVGRIVSPPGLAGQRVQINHDEIHGIVSPGGNSVA
jgi:hypothetical protein